MTKKPKNTTKSTPKGQRSIASLLLAILALMVFWFLVWLYDWQDEIMKLFGKSADVLPSKNTTGSTTTDTTGDKVIEFTTLNNTVVQRIVSNDNDNFLYKQPDPAFVWAITHGLQRVVTVQCFDTGGKVIYPDVQNIFEEHINDKTGQPYMVVNTTILTFSEATAGLAVFS
jgi:hypothetical protein